MQNMLRPIVEAAGYLVIGEGDELLPDLVIQTDGAAPTASGSARVLTLAADPEAADGDAKIYRYDRAGLMLALKSAGAGRAQ
jgi:two-component system chemotaxis sensor kinase CheA